MMKKYNRILSLLMVVLLLSSLAVPVLAETYYLEDGSVSIEATSTDGGQTQIQTVTQNGTSVNDAAPVVTQRDNSTATSNNVTIESSGGATAVVTVENVNIDTGSDTAGGDTSAIDVVNGSQAVITVSGENHVNAGHNINGNHDYKAAVHVGDSVVVIQGADGKGDTLNVANDSTMGAAIGSDYGEAFSGNLTIRDVTVTTTDGNIGSGMTGDFSGTMVIDGANVSANGNHHEPGIGAGGYGDVTETGTIIISGQSDVTATSSEEAGIGGGYGGDFSGTVIVAGGSTVKATGRSGAGIGGGYEGDFSGTVIVAGDSTVKVTGSYGAGIGSGMDGDYRGTVIQETGSTITAAGGNDGAGLGVSNGGKPHDAEVKETVDLTGYPTAPADPAPLPWNDAMFPKAPDPVPPSGGAPAPGTAAPAPGTAAPEPQTPGYDVAFWNDVEDQLRAAKKGDTVTVDAAWRTILPGYILETVAQTGVILVIQWDGGEDITLDNPFGGEIKFALYALYQLPEQLAE